MGGGGFCCSCTFPLKLLRLSNCISLLQAQSQETYVVLSDWPISCTLRPVESPYGTPQAQLGPTNQFSPGLKEGPHLAQGPAKLPMKVQQGECEWLCRGAGPRGVNVDVVD